MIHVPSGSAWGPGEEHLHSLWGQGVGLWLLGIYKIYPVNFCDVTNPAPVTRHGGPSRSGLWPPLHHRPRHTGRAAGRWSLPAFAHAVPAPQMPFPSGSWVLLRLAPWPPLTP